MMRRLPIESSQPILLFALSRVAIVVVGLTAMLVLSLPEDERAVAVVASIALPWSLLVLGLTLRNPQLGMSNDGGPGGTVDAAGTLIGEDPRTRSDRLARHSGFHLFSHVAREP